MSMLDSVVSVQISRQTVFPSRVGFGTQMILAYHALVPVLAYYSSLAAVVAAGHSLTGRVYKLASAAFSQNPCPAQIAIGKRNNPTTQVVTLTPKVTTPGVVVSYVFTDKNGLSSTISHTNGSSETPTTIAAALNTALGAVIVGATSAAVSGVQTITSTTAGSFFDLSALPPLTVLAVKDISADPGVTADLTAIQALDSIGWYGFTLDNSSKAEILAAAAWCETTRHLHYCQSSDSEIADNTVTIDIASALKAAAYARTGLMYSQTELANGRAFALQAKLGTVIPGASTWEYQTIAGDTPDAIDDASLANIQAKNAAVYVTLAGVNITKNVKIADSEFVDLIPGTDKLYADIQFNVYNLFQMASNSGTKIPYTDPGIDQVKNQVANALTAGVDAGFLSSDPAPTVSAPKVATLPLSVINSRNLPGITFSATLAGAIHTTAITGVLIP